MSTNTPAALQPAASFHTTDDSGALQADGDDLAAATVSIAPQHHGAARAQSSVIRVFADRSFDRRHP